MRVNVCVCVCVCVCVVSVCARVASVCKQRNSIDVDTVSEDVCVSGGQEGNIAGARRRQTAAGLFRCAPCRCHRPVAVIPVPCPSICAYACMHVRTCLTHMHLHLQVYTFAHIDACRYACMHVSTRTCMQPCMLVYKHSTRRPHERWRARKCEHEREEHSRTPTHVRAREGKCDKAGKESARGRVTTGESEGWGGPKPVPEELLSEGKGAEAGEGAFRLVRHSS